MVYFCISSIARISFILACVAVHPWAPTMTHLLVYFVWLSFHYDLTAMNFSFSISIFNIIVTPATDLVVVRG